MGHWAVWAVLVEVGRNKLPKKMDVEVVVQVAAAAIEPEEPMHIMEMELIKCHGTGRMLLLVQLHRLTLVMLDQIIKIAGGPHFQDKE